MITAIVTHKVKDFDKFITHFEANETLREKKGSKGSRILRKLDEPEKVLVELKWDSLERFNEFFQSDDLKNAMEKAGVFSKPEVEVLNEIGVYPR